MEWCFRLMKEGNCYSRLLYPAKGSFSNEGGMKTFKNKNQEGLLLGDPTEKNAKGDAS